MIATSEVSTGKKGTACAKNFASFISYGDMSIEAAKINGGITKVSTVSQSVESISFLYTKKCTIVTVS